MSLDCLINEKQKKSVLHRGDFLINIVGASIGRAAQFNLDCKANMNQAEIDHIEPKSKGGSNSYSNAQVLSKEENLRKGNKIE